MIPEQLGFGNTAQDVRAFDAHVKKEGCATEVVLMHHVGRAGKKSVEWRRIPDVQSFPADADGVKLASHVAREVVKADGARAVAVFLVCKDGSASVRIACPYKPD